jgi:DNA-binding NarL/FixJ family response regulator
MTFAKGRLLIADDHLLFAEGMRQLLAVEYREIRVVHDGRSLVAAAQSWQPDFIILDISMPELNGIDAMAQIRRFLPAAPMMCLTMHREPEYVTASFEAGASGYLLKQAAREELMTALHEVSQGRTYVSPAVAKGMLGVLMNKPGSTGVKLTVRQREVLQMVGEGRTAKEIANVLNISPRTADFHKNRIMQLLNLHTTAELTKYAIKIGLTQA